MPYIRIGVREGTHWGYSWVYHFQHILLKSSWPALNRNITLLLLSICRDACINPKGNKERKLTPQNETLININHRGGEQRFSFLYFFPWIHSRWNFSLCLIADGFLFLTPWLFLLFFFSIMVIFWDPLINNSFLEMLRTINFFFRFGPRRPDDYWSTC